MTSTTAYKSVAEIMKKYDVVVGLEVHCQLATASKIFCFSANSFGDQPNANIDPTCTGLPGALPVVNEACVDLALRMGLATSCTIPPVSVFARKNYFYPDLPKGYQITQFDKPICLDGVVELESGKKIRIERIQLEEDAGKNLHTGFASLVDYNRSGVGLIEIVSYPDISTPEEASEYLKKLHELAVHLDISDGDLERGNFRFDANVSIKPKGTSTLGQRCEIKNVNSFKNVEKAIAYEVERHMEVLESGGRIVMETRGFDSDRGVTFSQRSKESAHDYRYFPEPDLPPLIVSKERVARVQKSMPELPEAKARRFVSQLGLPEYDAKLLTASRRNSAYFEALVKSLEGKVEAKTVSSFFLTEILRALKLKADETGVTPEDLTHVPIPLEQSKDLLALQADGTISGRMAKDVFEEMLSSGKAPRDIVKERCLVQVSDNSVILPIVERVLNENPSQLAEYFGGREKAFGFFVGQAMKLGGGKLNPATVNELLKEQLAKRKTSQS